MRWDGATGVLEELIRQGPTKAVVGILCDPEAAEAAHHAGEGGKINIALGGKHGPAGVKPCEGEFSVTRLGNGQIVSTGTTIRGRKMELGRMALLTIGGVSIIVSSKRMQAYEPGLFRHVGVEPKNEKILALKSAVHFRADFEPISEEVLVVLSPGGHVVDPTQYAYKRLRADVRLGPLGPRALGEARERSNNTSADQIRLQASLIR